MASMIFLRHGQAQNNVMRVLSGRTPGVKLTEDGIRQAEGAAALIKKMNVTRIYTSPIERARRTAEIISSRNGADLIQDDRLIELDMGKFTGTKYDDIIAMHGNVFLKFYSGDLELAHNGVETFDEVKRRMISIIQEASANHPGENIVFVTHMDPIKAVLSTVVDLRPQFLFELIVANASMTIFERDADEMYLQAINVMDTARFGQEW